MEAELYQQMFEQEQRHWWFRAKRRVVLSLLQRLVPAEGGRPRVADIGCGCGATLLELGLHYDAVGIDGSPLAVEFSKRRGVTVVEGLLPDGIPFPPGTFDAVLMLDVLEHLDAPAAAARAAANLLKPGGIFLATVPAYQWLFSAHDQVHHHKRRYRRGELVTTLEDAGVTPIFSSYMNCSLFPLAAVARMLDRLRHNSSAKTLGLNIPPAPVNWLFENLFAGEQHLLGRVRLPFGLSVIAAGRRS